MTRKGGEHRPAGREVYVGLVHHQNAVEAVGQRLKIVGVEGVACGIVGRAYPYQPGVGVGGRKERIGVEREIVGKHHFAILHVVDSCRHAIHSVARRNGYGVVYARAAEYAVGQVDGLVASGAPHEYARFVHALKPGYGLFEFLLMRIGIAVDAVGVGRFVGVEPHRYVASVEFVACGGIRFEGEYVGSYESERISHEQCVCR